MSLNGLQWMRALAGRWQLLASLGQAAQELADPAVNSMEKRWEIIKPVGDELAPELDKIIAEFGKPAASSIMSTEAELEASLLTGLQQAFIDHHVNAASRGMVLAATADEEAKNKFAKEKTAIEAKAREQATTQARRFDGHFLRGAIELAKTLAPLLTALAPLLVK
jgi:hypothetical protein